MKARPPRVATIRNLAPGHYLVKATCGHTATLDAADMRIVLFRIMGGCATCMNERDV